MGTQTVHAQVAVKSEISAATLSKALIGISGIRIFPMNIVGVESQAPMARVRFCAIWFKATV